MKSDHAHIPLVQAAREQGSISVWRMPTSLSQSRLGGRNSPSNACTVIAVRMAEVIHRTDTKMPSAIYRTKATYECDGRQVSSRNQRAAAGHEGVPEIKNNSEKETNLACPLRVISCLTNAIVDGNCIHEEAVKNRTNGEQNFTIPDAIHACKNAVKEIDFCSVPGPLWTELPFYIRAVVRSPALSRDIRLFLLLIAFERTVLIVFERTTSSLTLFDSHMHSQSEGAVIATGHIDNVEDLCHWLSCNIFHESQTQDERNREFEISLIRFCGETSSNDCCLPNSTVPCEFPVFASARRRRKRRFDATRAILKPAKHAKIQNPEDHDKEDLRPLHCSRTQTLLPLASLDNLRSRNII
ncbi:hypothetical protein RB195_011486 [Necator americanus]|uniref:Uncharacterized protein n=1 Tax=Necator americanus TaxID=51031 RepID=A0ABR1D2P1_NECAM